MLHIPPAKDKYSSPNHSNKKEQEPHKRAYLLENGGLGKIGQEKGPKAETGKTEIATGLDRRTREERRYRKV